MALKVYDFHHDLRNILVTPQIRARFMPLGVGQTARGHTHDLGHEVFLILQGRAEFEIDGEKAILGPGQACIALIDQSHIVRNIGDEEVIMYLSVTPHILPTHTFWTAEGEKQPPHFNPSWVYDVAPDNDTPLGELTQRHLGAITLLLKATAHATEVVERETQALHKALEAGIRDEARRARDEMWAALRELYLRLFEQAQAWNDLAARTAD
ncbi:MAG: cupin domain-containing protein, partial [Chloroflexi bacterium]|nr:cupin domain-containing protein [Chloroflexota bacterium]